MRYKIKNIRLSMIDSDDGIFRVTTEENIDELADSIKEFGLINLPTLIRSDCDRYKIVCGFRRIASCEKLEIERIEAKMLSSNTTRLNCVKIAVSDNSLSRPLNLLEQSKAILILSRCFEKEEKENPEDKAEFVKVAASLGFPKNLSLLEDLKKISLLPGIVRKKILSGRIPFATAVKLARFKKRKCIEFAEIFDRLKLGLNRQKEFATLAEEIAIREDITTHDIFSDENFLKIADDDDQNIPEKRKKVFIYLRKRRFPAVSKAMEDFKAALEKLNLRHGAAITPPKSFEKSTYRAGGALCSSSAFFRKRGCQRT